LSDDELAPSGGGRSALPYLIVGQVGLHAGLAGLRMAAPLQALHDGWSAGTVGVLMALFAAAPVLLAMPAGRLADRHGYHRPVRLAAAAAGLGIASALAAVLAGGGGRLALLGVAALLVGAGVNLGLIAVQRTAGLEARDAAERVRVYSWLAVAPSFANVVGPVAAGFLIDAAGFGAAYALLLALPALTLAAARRVPAVRPPGSASRAGGSVAGLLGAPGIKRLLVLNWLLSMCWDVHSFAVPVLGHERGFSASTIGLVLGTFTLAATGVRLFIPVLAHRLDERRVVGGAMLVTALVFCLYPFAAQPWTMASCAAVLGVSLGSVQPMLMSALHRLTPGDRHGEALAFRSMTINASSTVMPLVFGATGAVAGAGVLFWVVGAAVGAGSWLARRLGVVEA
jgi:MFS family permease